MSKTVKNGHTRFLVSDMPKFIFTNNLFLIFFLLLGSMPFILSDKAMGFLYFVQPPF